jgi:hypothetical protein
MLQIHRYVFREKVLFSLLALLIPFSFKCIQEPLKPKAPSWTTQLTIPLIDRTYYFSDLIVKDTAFTTVNGEVVYKPASLQNEPTAISIPELNPVKASFVRQLGIIPLSAVTLPGITLSFQELTGQSPPPLPWPGPEISTIQNKELISDTTSYDYLIYEEGVMTLTITNTFNFDVSFAPGGIQMVDTTVVPEEVLGTFNIGQVTKNGGSVTATISLNGKRMSSVLRMKFQFQTVDLTGKIVDNNGNISSVITITKDGTSGSDPTLAEAKMKLANAFYVPVSSVRDSVQKLSDSVFIRTAEFSGGEFDILINNGIPFDVIIGFNLREFRHKAANHGFRLIDPQTNQPSDSISLTGGQHYAMNVLMKDYELQARKENRNDPTVNDTLTNGLHFSLDIKTLVKTDTKKIIKKTDSIIVQIVPKEVGGTPLPYTIDYVRGKIPPTPVAITEEVPAGIGSSTDKFNADSVKLEGAQIILKIFTNSLFPTDLKFTVQGILNGIPGNALSTPAGNRPSSNDPDPTSYRIFPGDTAKIIFDDAHPDPNGKTLSQFLSSFVQNGKFKFPEKFIVKGKAVLEPIDAYKNDEIGYVKNDDSVYTSLDFTFPLKIGIKNGSYKDTASIAGNIQDTSQINSIAGGRIFFDLHSTFPIGIEVQSKLLKPDPSDSSKPSFTAEPVLLMDTLRVDGDDSPNRTGKKSFTFISLTGEEAAKISQAAFTAIDVKLASALNGGSTPVAFTPTDSITVRASASIKFNVDFDRIGKK